MNHGNVSTGAQVIHLRAGGRPEWVGVSGIATNPELPVLYEQDAVPLSGQRYDRVKTSVYDPVAT